MEIQKILVTFDGSKHSEKGLDIAISLVKESEEINCRFVCKTSLSRFY